jgi:hypothetical protein
MTGTRYRSIFIVSVPGQCDAVSSRVAFARQIVPVGATSMRMPSIRYRILMPILITAGISLGILAMLVLNRDPEMGRGSNERAAKWKAVFAKLPDLEVIKTKYPFAATKRYDDGSWIFGVGEDSHGDRDGGTIIVRDSDGKTKVFFGHVCGPDFLQDGFSRSSSAADLYRLLSESQFKFSEKTVP